MDDSMWEAYNNAKATVEAFERVIELERENEELRIKVKKHEDSVDTQYREQMNTIGKTISALVK